MSEAAWPMQNRRIVLSTGPVSAPPPKKAPAYKPKRGEPVRFIRNGVPSETCGRVHEVWPTRAFVIWDGSSTPTPCDFERLMPKDAPVVEPPKKPEPTAVIVHRPVTTKVQVIREPYVSAPRLITAPPRPENANAQPVITKHGVRTVDPVKHCEYCEEQFFRHRFASRHENPRVFATRRYCSQECRIEAYRAHANERQVDVQRFCKQCGDQLVRRRTATRLEKLPDFRRRSWCDACHQANRDAQSSARSEVIRLIGEGVPYRQIAAITGVSKSQVYVIASEFRVEAAQGASA